MADDLALMLTQQLDARVAAKTQDLTQLNQKLTEENLRLADEVQGITRERDELMHHNMGFLSQIADKDREIARLKRAPRKVPQQRLDNIQSLRGEIKYFETKEGIIRGAIGTMVETLATTTRKVKLELQKIDEIRQAKKSKVEKEEGGADECKTTEDDSADSE
jgi:hypothetical protein